jgi:hypothetical protein
MGDTGSTGTGDQRSRQFRGARCTGPARINAQRCSKGRWARCYSGCGKWNQHNQEFDSSDGLTARVSVLPCLHFASGVLRLWVVRNPLPGVVYSKLQSDQKSSRTHHHLYTWESESVGGPTQPLRLFHAPTVPLHSGRRQSYFAMSY